MLASLHKDHLNIARLLALLKHKLAAIRSEQPVSYFLIRDVVDYLREVSDKYHHPKEDMIYDYYLKYRVVEGEVASRLQEEHARLLEAGAELKEMVEMILMDAVIPLDQFTARLEQFVALQEAHMNYEEGVIFPHLRDSLTEDDWRHLEQIWHNRAIGDPLFGAEISQHFQELAKRLSLPLSS
ncbi:hemerythrin domain-containing protein [Aeromonas piscicola]|jgi:hemerythrin-like domain-containing protein|uniref:hemerythrin domain-containing protein n=1 Tax=Aeromonas piscicola TaxID=600645 RepID=UPI0005B36165|nr:hemerythrin domain-containing protein [Aeromonas piscicola]